MKAPPLGEALGHAFGYGIRSWRPALWEPARARSRCSFMRGPRLDSDARENRVRRMAARQRFSLISRRGEYALTDAFGELEPRSRAFGFNQHGSPAASLDEIEAYLNEERSSEASDPPQRGWASNFPGASQPSPCPPFTRDHNTTGEG
jgi:hypothetical protein